MSRRQFNFSLGVGSVALITVFVVLCFTAFGSLSLLSARNDHALAQRTAQGVTEYYAAEARAETALAQAAQGHDPGEGVQVQVEAEGADRLITIETRINEIKFLRLTALVAPGGELLELRERRTVVDAPWEGEEELPVIKEERPEADQ